MYLILVLKLVVLAVIATLLAMLVNNVWTHVMITMNSLPQF